MHEEKSRGSGLESHETRLEVTGDGTQEVAAAAVWGKRGQHASSGHGTVQGGFPVILAGSGLGMGCARMRERAGG
ncbi:hypothetical protein CRG98_029694 [Punica granatum]|uniref:Uncharacterized protein n=1 Tax=Punica granatum TaxID=22663 RepID=A0A2I0J1W1_PUNGR|nr:hypothetical protein CRG98_029694 [Punica granatum]